MPGAGGGGGGGNVLGMAVAAYNIFGGLINTSKANAEAKFLESTKPVKKTSQFDRDALNLAESDLANGMSAETEQAYDDTDARSLSSSISAILKSGGSSNNISDMYGNSAQARQQMAVVRENLRQKKVETYLSELDTMAEEEEKNWLVNDYGPYINKLKAVGEAKKAAAEQTAKGLDSLGGSGGDGGGGGGNRTMSDDDGGDGDGGFNRQERRELRQGNRQRAREQRQYSDRRLKHNYHIVGRSPSGINIYEFSYLGSNTRYQGVMADEVGYAAGVGENGFMWVDYSLIDVEFKKI